MPLVGGRKGRSSRGRRTCLPGIRTMSSVLIMITLLVLQRMYLRATWTAALVPERAPTAVQHGAATARVLDHAPLVLHSHSHSTNDRTQIGSAKDGINSTNAPSGGRAGVAIVIVSDKAFQLKQAFFLAGQRAYAMRHGYDFVLLDPADEPRCRLKQFFFNKHCTVRTFLAQQPHGYAALVLDGDNVVVAPDVPLDKWLADGSDVMLYEREWNFEVTAGNYLVRNTEFGLYFLDTWMHFAYRQHTVKGFSSFDNGAVHLALLQVLGFAESIFALCTTLYSELTETDVNKLEPYYQFVACTRYVLGPNRHWRVRGIVSGAINFKHRFHGPSVDAHLLDRVPGGAIPFYHGDKKPVDAVKQYGMQFKRVNATEWTPVWKKGVTQETWRACAFEAPICEVRYTHSSPFKTAAEQAAKLVAQEAWWSSASKNTMAWRLVPRVNLESCLFDPIRGTALTCTAASKSGEPGPDLYRRLVSMDEGGGGWQARVKQLRNAPVVQYAHLGSAHLYDSLSKAEAKATAQAQGKMPAGTKWRQSPSAFSDTECANAGNLPKMTKHACQLKCLADYPKCTAVNFHAQYGCVLRACVSAKAPASPADTNGWVSYRLVPAGAKAAS